MNQQRRGANLPLKITLTSLFNLVTQTFLSRKLSLLCLHLVATARHRICLYVPVFCSFLFYEPISIISRQQTGVSSTLWFGSVLRGLRAMKLVVGAMQTHPVMGWLQRNWGCALGRTPTPPSSTPFQPPAVGSSLLRCLPNKQATVNTQLRLSQLSRESFVKARRLVGTSYLICDVWCDSCAAQYSAVALWCVMWGLIL